MYSSGRGDARRTVSLSQRLPSLRDWILNDVPPANITEYKSFNFDYDLKRKPDLETAHDQGLVGTFLTKPWQTVEDFFSCRKAYQNYGRDSGLREEATEGESPARVGTGSWVLSGHFVS